MLFKKLKVKNERRKYHLILLQLTSVNLTMQDADKVGLAEATGLDQKQINYWFINQRKRHWKPSENMQIAVMDSLYGPFFMND